MKKIVPAQPNVYIPPWSDATGWSSASYYATMQSGDVNSDGKAELFGRTAAGMQTWGLNAATAQWQQLATGDCGFTDDNGWDQPQYYATIQNADVDGDGQAELMGRGKYGIDTWKFDTATSAWVNLALGSCGFTDDNGWDQPQYYTTIQCADVDGDGQAELMGRGKYGIDTWKYDTTQNPPAWVNLATGSCGFTDDNGWDQPQYYTTIQCADIDADGQAELMGRGKYGIDTWKYDAATSTWVNLALGSCGFTDAAYWDQPQYYATIQCADIDGDGQAEIIGRGSYGINTWKFDPAQSTWANVSSYQGDFTDANGWNLPQYYATIACADVNGDGRAELLGRYSPGVETVAFDAATGGWEPIAPLISADARLMENYILANPAVAAGQYAVVANAAGELEVLAIGADGNVYEIYPDPTSDTGYSQAPVGVGAAQLAAGLTDEGLLLVLAANGSEVSYVLSEPTGSTTRWSAPQPLATLSGSVDSLAAVRIGGHLYVAVLADSTGTQWTYTTYLGQWSSSSPSPGEGYPLFIQPPGQPAATALGTALENGPTVPVFWIVCGNTVTGRVFGGGQTFNLAGPNGATVVSVTAVTDAQGDGHLFAVFSDGGLYELTTDMTWNPVLANGPALATVSGALNAQTSQVELYATGRDARLRLILPADSSASDLGVPATAARVAVDGDGLPATFAAANGALTRVWRSADTTDWSTSAVDVSSLGQLQPVTSYTAEITIRDEMGLARANEPVTIAPSDAALLTVNGVTAWVDAEHPMATTADARGKVTVMTQTASLSAPTLVVTPGFLPEGTGVVVELNGAVQARLREVGANDLLNPVDMFGNALAQPLLPGTFNNQSTASALAGTVAQSMTLVTPTAVGAATNRIDHTRVPEQHWRLRLCADGTAQFTQLARAEARSVIAAHRASLEAGNFLGIDWGDAWQAVREGVGAIVDEASNLLDITVSTAADGITVAVTWLIDNVEYAFNGLIELVEQAFDIVEGIFESIGTAFDTLVQWLGFLFDWTDISRTAQAVSFLYAQCLELLPGALNWLQTELTSAIDQFGSQLAQMFDQFAASVSGQHDIVTLASSAGPPPAELEYSHANNVMLTALLGNSNSATPLSSATARARDTGPIDVLITQLETYADQFESPESFTTALNYFSQMAQQLPNQPDQALRSALAGLIEVLSSLAQLALEAASLVVNAVLATLSALIEAVGDALQMQWEIPLVSQLYQYVTQTNDPLTPIGLAGLLVAIPATVYSKLTTGSAPFADDAALQQFQSTCTAQAILQSLPTAGAQGTTGRPATINIPVSDLKVIYLVGLIAEGLFYGGSAIVDIISQPVIVPPNPEPWEPVMGAILTVIELVGCICTCPGFDLSPAPWLEWFAWCLSALLPVVFDTTWVLYFGRITQAQGDLGAVISILLGIGGAIGATIWKFAGDATWMQGISGWLGALPLICKALRIRNIAYWPLPIPPGGDVYPWTLIALGAIDGAAGSASALLTYWAAKDGLKQDSLGPAVPPA